MPKHEDVIRLQHMLDHAREAVDLSCHRSRKDLDMDRQLNLSLVRLLEIVGEAANRVSGQTQMQFPQVPWPQIIGMRNRLIHGYNDVDFDILWQIITADLPPLIRVLQNILSGK